MFCSQCFQNLKSFSREWTCEECTDGLVQISTIFTQQTYIDDIVAFLQVVNVIGDYVQDYKDNSQVQYDEDDEERRECYTGCFFTGPTTKFEVFEDGKITTKNVKLEQSNKKM